MILDEFAESLRGAGIRRVMTREPMSRHTSWRIGGPADYLCSAETADQLRGAVALAQARDLPWLVIGGGNNILVADDGIEGLVILNRLRGLSIEPMDAEAAQLTCGAGVFFARAALYSAQHGYTGMEWGIAIPGTIGGGIVNNAGAHAADVGRTVISASVVDADGRQETLTVADLTYRYRYSALKTGHTRQTRLVVIDARFRLERGDREQALARIEELRLQRLRTQPVKEASAGSTFKNPPAGHAGALIDDAGLKGTRIGGAQISPLHANFILNVDNASAADVTALVLLAQERVLARTGIELEPEIQYVGRWPLDSMVTAR